MITNEFDKTKEAIINPWDIVCKEVRVKGEMPKIAVCCFEGKTFYRLVELLNGELIAATKNANGDEPIYKVTYKGKEKELFQFFYTADCLDGTKWDERSLSDEVKFEEKDFFSKIAIEFATRI